MFSPHKIAFLHESDYHNNLMGLIIWIRKRIWRYQLAERHALRVSSLAEF
jgi:hypothetical protein